MLRFFRKYQKILLAVGGSILLVIFLVPQAIQGIGGYVATRGRTMSTFVTTEGETRKISAAEFTVAQRDLTVITKGIGFNLGLLRLLPLVEDAAHWILLTHEAEQLGLVGGIDDARAVAAQLGGFVAQSLRAQGIEITGAPEFEQIISLVSQKSQVTGKHVIETFTRIMSVQRLLALYATTPRISDRRIASYAAEILQGIDATVLVLSANEDAEALPEPTEADLQALLDAHGEDQPGEGDRGFGYRLPPRVHLEWLVISEDTIREKLKHSDDMSPLELRKYWLQNKLSFIPPGVTDPDAVVYSDVAEDVHEALLDELLARTSDDIVRFAEGEINRHTRDLERSQGYYMLPDDWSTNQINLVELADSIQARFDAGLPEYHRRSDEWLSADDLRIEPDLGLARTTALGATRGLTNLLPLLKEFGGDEAGAIFVQQGITGPVLRFGDTAIFYRIVDTDDSRPPASIDEARDALVSDFKKAADYDRLSGITEEIRSQALTVGMEAIGDEYDTFAQPQRNIGWAPEGANLMRVNVNATRFLPPVGRHEESINTIVARGQELIDVMMSEGQPFDDFALDELTMLVEVPDKLSLLVVQFTGLRPLVFDTLRANLESVVQMLVQDQFGDQPVDFFSEEAMLERYQYESSTSNNDDTEADGDDAATSDPASATEPADG